MEEKLISVQKIFPIKLQFKIFQNKKYLDIRKWYLDRKKNEVLPTKKGISLSDYQFNEIFRDFREE